MNEAKFRQMALGINKPKPSGKDARRIRKMLREGIPPASMPFDPQEVDKIYAKLPTNERKKIVRKVTDIEVEVKVTDAQADHVILKMAQQPFASAGRPPFRTVSSQEEPRRVFLPSSQMPR